MLFNIPAGLLLIGGVVALILAFVVLRRWSDRTARALAIYQLGVIGVSLAYAGELMATELPAKTFWVSLRYLGWMVQLIALPYFVFWYTRGPERMPRGLRLVLIGFPIIITAAQITNPLHHLYYTAVWLDTSGSIPMFAKSNGLLYWIYQIYAFALFLAAAIFLLRTMSLSKRVYQSQAIFLVIGLVIPILAESLYLAGLRPLPYLNLTPFSYLLTGAFLTWALFRHRTLELRPIALDQVFNRIPSAVLVVDGQGFVADINRAGMRLLSLQTGYRGGKTFESICATWPELAALIRDVQECDQLQLIRERDPSQKAYAIDIVPLERKPSYPAGRLVLIRDITIELDADKRRVEQQRALAALEERERLARELHDSLGQVIVYLNLEAQNTLRLLQTGQVGLAQATLERIVEVVGETQGDMRELLFGMRQEFAGTSDFYVALEKYVQEFSRVYEFPVQLHLPLQSVRPALAVGTEVHLLRVIQECLSNIRRHAQATQAKIFFSFESQEAQVTIEDDGRGFDPSAPGAEGDHSLHFGLDIMRERTREMKGTLQLVSAPGQGTRVMVRLPLAMDAQAPRNVSGWRVVLADDHPLFRDGLKNLLVARGVDVVGMARDGEEAVERVLALQPDIAILDIQMPLKDGIQAAAEIKQRAPQVRILMLTMSSDEATLYKAIQAGASGYLLKDLKAEDFLARLDALMNGEILLPAGLAEKMLQKMSDRPEAPEEALNDRQLDILKLMAQRLTYAQIGERLHLSESTIKYHTAQIIEKLHVSGRAEALAEAANRGLIERRKGRR